MGGGGLRINLAIIQIYNFHFSIKPLKILSAFKTY